MKLCTACNTLYGPDFTFCPRDETPLVPAPKETMALYDPMRGLLLDGRYRLATAMGSGTLGDVYAATFESLEKPVAIKILHSEYARKPEWAENFLMLARRQATVEHRHLASVSDFGHTPDGRPFFVMDWHSGGHLGELLHSTGPLPTQATVTFGLQIAMALEAAHQAGLIHQNLKPSNVRLPSDERGNRMAVVTDLGLFTPSGTGVTCFGRDLLLYGTPQFMAPEQVRGQPPTAATDVYQLGLLLYTMVAGTPPFSGESFHELLSAQVQSEPPPFQASLHCPPELDRLIRSMLQKDPARRPANMRVVRLRLLDALNTSRRWVIRGAIILGAAAVAFTVWWLAGNSRPSQPGIRNRNPRPTTLTNPVLQSQPVPAPAETSVRIFIDSVPSGGQISLSGQVRQAPAWFDLPRGLTPLTGRVKHPLRPELDFTLIPKQTGQVFIHLDHQPGVAPMQAYVPKGTEPELMDPFH
ncbi:MAG: hypothetical protein CVU65_05410 [Deltaproteobacteria bacterium HGW-Deltaproteobacteria-22]|jgi:serine/threonine-protein kinase|nr:MAG: hypothetical protein CVU65_05410 [Deltaproteobacteria bacterium HGW-Deltaproteobacteria-22]